MNWMTEKCNGVSGNLSIKMSYGNGTKVFLCWNWVYCWRYRISKVKIHFILKIVDIIDKLPPLISWSSIQPWNLFFDETIISLFPSLQLASSHRSSHVLNFNWLQHAVKEEQENETECQEVKEEVDIVSGISNVSEFSMIFPNFPTIEIVFWLITNFQAKSTLETWEILPANTKLKVHLISLELCVTSGSPETHPASLSSNITITATLKTQSALSMEHVCVEPEYVLKCRQEELAETRDAVAEEDHAEMTVDLAETEDVTGLKNFLLLA